MKLVECADRLFSSSEAVHVKHLKEMWKKYRNSDVVLNRFSYLIDCCDSFKVLFTLIKSVLHNEHFLLESFCYLKRY